MSCKPSRNICPVGATSERGRADSRSTGEDTQQFRSTLGPAPTRCRRRSRRHRFACVAFERHRNRSLRSPARSRCRYRHRRLRDTSAGCPPLPIERRLPTGDRGPCVRRDGGAQNRLAASTGGPDTSSGAPWSPEPMVSTASGYLVCKLQPSPDPMSCMEVGAQHVGLAAKAAGCVVLVRRAVMGCLRLALALELSNDRVDVWHYQLAPGRLG